MNDYFIQSFLAATSTGRLVRMVGDHNNAKVSALSRDIREGARSRKWVFGLVDEQLIIRLRYRDLLDRAHEDYYEVQVVGCGTYISETVGKELFSRWQSGRRRELSDLRADDLLDLLSANRAAR